MIYYSKIQLIISPLVEILSKKHLTLIPSFKFKKHDIIYFSLLKYSYNDIDQKFESLHADIYMVF